MFITTALFLVQWMLPEINPVLYVGNLFFAVSVAVMSHNHNHCPTWKSKRMNALTDYWLTLFYGFPVFAWIPTHNMNHHKYNNREGDYTRTWRYTEKNNLLTLLTYPAISAYHQQTPIRDYLATKWKRDRRRFFHCIMQYVLLGALVVGTLLIDWQKSLLLVIIPHQFALFTILVFNYLQHVHTDEESEINHSRNIVGPLMNILLFNNGYHTVHHDKPGLHWSKLPEAHAAIEHKMDPRVNERSFWWLIIRVYILGLFIPRMRSNSLRLERMQRSGETEQQGELVGQAA
jgi:fatty acid desaturase